MSGGQYPYHPNRYSAQTSPNSSRQVEQTQVPSTTWDAGDVQESAPEGSLDTTSIDAPFWRSELAGSQLAGLFPVQDHVIDGNIDQTLTPTQIPQDAEYMYVESASQLGFDPQLVLSTDFSEYDFTLSEDFSFTDNPNH
jgi:hypothetical protein